MMQQFPQANMACAGHLNNGCQRVNGCCNSFMGGPCQNACHGPLSSFAMAGAGGFGGDPWGVGGGGFGNPWFQPPIGGGFGGGLGFPPGLPGLGLPLPSMSLSLGISLNA